MAVTGDRTSLAATVATQDYFQSDPDGPMGNSSTAEELALEIAGTSAKIALHDNVWRGFGYRGRPKRGALFTKLLRLFPGEKIDREEFLVREITAICIATLSQGTGGRGVTPAELAARALESMMGYKGVAQAFGFGSPREGARHIAIAVGEYMRAGQNGKPAVLLTRADSRLDDVPEEEWIVGSIRLCTMGPAENAVMSIVSKIDFPVSGEVYLSNPTLIPLIQDHEPSRQESH